MDMLIGFSVAALKAGVSGIVSDGIVKAIANQGIDVSLNRIKQYLEKTQKELSQVLSDKSLREMDTPENHIAYVQREIRELIQSIRLEEDLFRNCQYDADSLSKALYKKYKEQKKDYVEYEMEIQKILYVLSEKAILIEKEREGFVADNLIYIEKTEEEQTKLLIKILSILDESIKSQITDSESKGRKRLPDRTEEYSRKWKENMFLNDFDEDDDTAGVNILLKDLYQLPYYRLRDNEKDIPELEQRLDRCTQTMDRKRRTLLILGQPGIGKSTLITWFADHYQKKGGIDKKEILVYRFTDFNIDWNIYKKEKRKSIDSAILKSLNMQKEDLNEKILILDGFDEVMVNNRAEILNQLYNAWSEDAHIKNFSLLITCRENYIENLSELYFPYIILQPWNRQQIEEFCRNYEKNAKLQITEEAIKKLQNMQQVFGIPIILYMTLALNISIRNENSVVEIYDQIFSLESGIYDRCLKRKGYVRWDYEHRIAEIKKQIHQFSREISMWMFENNSQQVAIPKVEYEKIRDNIFMKDECIDKSQNRDVLIGNYFKMVRYYDGVDTEQLTFVHRSIYEYFVAETIYNEIRDAVTEMTEKAQETVAGVLGYRLKAGKIDYTIGQYLKTKVSMLIESLNEEKKYNFYVWLEETVGKMLNAGMLYYTRKNIKEYRNVIEKEIVCFLNILSVLRLFLDFSHQKYILENIKNKQIRLYIRYLTSLANEGIDIVIDLSKINLSETNLNGIDMFGVNLSSANLTKASLNETYLRSAILNKADLTGANLCGANLSRIDLTGANLSKANLSGTNLKGAIFRRADLRGANFNETVLNETDLDQSIWKQEDVEKYIDIIKQSEFEGIFICSDKTDEMRLITRSELLSQYLHF